MRLSQREMNFLLFHVALFVIIPYLPRDILILTDNILIRIILLAWIIMAAYHGPMMAISAFIVVVFLFIMRNRIKIRHMEKIMSQSTPESPAIEEIQTPETAPAQPVFDTPVVESHSFFPQEDSGSDAFAPVAESMNQKIPLPTEGSNDGSQKAINQLFRWVNPTPAQEGP
jgi:hypothetical protein